MPKIVKPLSISQVKNAKPADKMYKLSDGGGLSLWVYPTGARSWKISFKDDQGKQQTISLGQYPDFTLAEAREWREDIRRKRAHGEQIIKPKTEESYLLKNVAGMWYERWHQDMAEKYHKQVWRLFERWILPMLGDRDIRDIKTADIVSCLRIMESRGIADTLRKTKNSLGLVFGYAVAAGTIEYNPVTQIGNKIFAKAKTSNMAALPPSELPRLIDFLEQRGEFANPTNRLKINATTRLAIYWLLLSMTRVQETCLAEWSEIDEKSGLWIVPAERKKERREHVVPLSDGLKWVLQQAREININGRYLFESYNFRSHLNKESPRMAMQRAGLDTTAHGLRSLARTYMREEMQIADDVAEKLLAHSLGNKTQTAYNRSELLAERTDALDRWSAVIMGLVCNK